VGIVLMIRPRAEATGETGHPGVGAGRLADADSEPPHRPRVRRFPSKSARGVRLEVMTVLYWY
jgi:hypothetical protein